MLYRAQPWPRPLAHGHTPSCSPYHACNMHSLNHARKHSAQTSDRHESFRPRVSDHCQTLLNICLDVRHPRDAVRAAQKRRRRLRLLLTADGRGALNSTLGTLERCQRPIPKRPSKLKLVLDATSAGGEHAVILDVLQMRKRTRNTCNVKSVLSRST